MTEEARRLYRSTKSKIVTGVLGGLGEYLHVDPNVVRLGFLLLFFFNPVLMMVLYVAAAMLLPEAPPGYQPAAPEKLTMGNLRLTAIVVIALIFVGMGMMFASAALGFLFTWIFSFPFRALGLGQELTSLGFVVFFLAFTLIGLFFLYLVVRELGRVSPKTG